MVRCDGGLVPVRIFDFDLLITAISVKRQENACFVEQVDTFMNSRYDIRVLISYGVQLVIAYAKSERYVFLWHNYEWCCPLDLGVFKMFSARIYQSRLLQILVFWGLLGMLLCVLVLCLIEPTRCGALYR